jgi:hypothetical protein
MRYTMKRNGANGVLVIGPYDRRVYPDAQTGMDRYQHVQWKMNAPGSETLAQGYMGGTDGYLVQRKCATCGGRVMVDHTVIQAEDSDPPNRVRYVMDGDKPARLGYFRCEKQHLRNTSKPGNPR